MSNFKKYEKAVIAISDKIHGHVCGTTEDWGYNHAEMENDVNWLEWRITEAWDTSFDLFRDYDEAVRSMARAAVAMGKKHILERRGVAA